jgi:hypothetical protein
MKEITKEENTCRCRHYTFVQKPAVERDGGGEELYAIHHQSNELTRGTLS